MEPNHLLRVDGAVRTPLALTMEDLARFPSESQVADVSIFHPERKGSGVELEALLAAAVPADDANYLTLHAGKDDFHVSIPLAAIRAEGIVVYQLDGKPLAAERGGPIRFLIRDPSACHTDELDDCANVKYLDRIELTVRKGRDTRPADEAAHSALHNRQT